MDHENGRTCMACGGLVGEDGLAAEMSYEDSELEDPKASEHQASGPKAMAYGGFASTVLNRRRDGGR